MVDNTFNKSQYRLQLISIAMKSVFKKLIGQQRTLFVFVQNVTLCQEFGYFSPFIV